MEQEQLAEHLQSLELTPSTPCPVLDVGQTQQQPEAEDSPSSSSQAAADNFAGAAAIKASTRQSANPLLQNASAAAADDAIQHGVVVAAAEAAAAAAQRHKSAAAPAAAIVTGPIDSLRPTAVASSIISHTKQTADPAVLPQDCKEPPTAESSDRALAHLKQEATGGVQIRQQHQQQQLRKSDAPSLLEGSHGEAAMSSDTPAAAAAGIAVVPELLPATSSNGSGPEALLLQPVSQGMPASPMQYMSCVPEQWALLSCGSPTPTCRGCCMLYSYML